MNFEEFDKLVDEQRHIIADAKNRVTEAEKEMLASPEAPKVGDVGVLVGKGHLTGDDEVRVARVEIKERYSIEGIQPHYYAVTYVNRKKKNGDFSNRDEWCGCGEININGKVFKTL
jgi:hypothetical protein